MVNLAVYRLAWHPRSISPWSSPLPKAPPRQWSDRIPIVGWLGLRRESRVHGGPVWRRPMIVEICGAILFPWLYRWEVLQLGILPALPMMNAPPIAAML